MAGVEEAGADRLDHLAHRRRLVARHVVNDHDVASISSALFSANVVGSGLIGRIDLRPTFVYLPLILVLEAVWFLWRVRTKAK